MAQDRARIKTVHTVGGGSCALVVDDDAKLFSQHEANMQLLITDSVMPDKSASISIWSWMNASYCGCWQPCYARAVVPVVIFCLLFAGGCTFLYDTQPNGGIDSGAQVDSSGNVDSSDYVDSGSNIDPCIEVQSDDFTGDPDPDFWSILGDVNLNGAGQLNIQSTPLDPLSALLSKQQLEQGGLRLTVELTEVDWYAPSGYAEVALELNLPSGLHDGYRIWIEDNYLSAGLRIGATEALICNRCEVMPASMPVRLTIRATEDTVGFGVVHEDQLILLGSVPRTAMDNVRPRLSTYAEGDGTAALVADRILVESCPSD